MRRVTPVSVSIFSGRSKPYNDVEDRLAKGYFNSDAEIGDCARQHAATVITRTARRVGGAAGLARARRPKDRRGLSAPERRVKPPSPLLPDSGLTVAPSPVRDSQITFRHSVIISPEPPNSLGKSFSFGSPSRIGNTASA